MFFWSVAMRISDCIFSSSLILRDWLMCWPNSDLSMILLRAMTRCFLYYCLSLAKCEILKRRLEMLLQLSQQVIQKVPVLSNEFLRDFLADLFKDLLLQVFMHNQNICYQL
jgi:hypothetical protein